MIMFLQTRRFSLEKMGIVGYRFDLWAVSEQKKKVSSCMSTSERSKKKFIGCLHS